MRGLLSLRHSGSATDEALLAAAAQGDVRAFEALYDRYSRAVYSLALRMLRDAKAVEEVTQEVFLSVWRGGRDYDPRRGSARSWILALAHHKSVDAVRHQRLRAADRLSEEMTGETDVVGEAIRSVEGARVREALAALSEVQREAITLAYYQGYTQQEIADRLGLPLGTVKTRMRDGMLRLRILLGRSMQGEQT
ncbi:MAG: sigma-70 family RNA polymerase sigma factor [Armatimonadetes bacterium]|nr:sigma-70 family RNA polymerase sigma factor [Armatimonadota bacterium]